jgi:hypothetical protein
VGRQHLLELYERPHGGLLDPAYRRSCRRAEANRDRDRLIVVEQERRHGGAGAQAVAARGPGERLDGVAEGPQALDVTANRPA